jgi:hypothetical protein
VAVTSHDADGDSVTYSYQWQQDTGSGWNNLAGATNVTLDLSVMGNGNRSDQLRVVVTPNDGTANGAPLTSNEVTVGNTAPVVTLRASNDLSVNEGSQHTYAFDVADDDADAYTVVAVSCGTNGSQVGLTSVGSGGGSFVCSFPDGPAGSTVSAQVKDSSDAVSNSATQAVTVANVAPVVTLTGASSADEGSTTTYTYTVTDVGQDAAATSVTESCGANGIRTNTPAVNSFDCTFPDGPASSTVSVTANDGDPTNNTGSDAITVGVANVAPVVVLTGADTANEGQTKTYTYTVTDAGADAATVTESCGANGIRTDTPVAFSFECTFPDGPASSTVKVTADDGDPSSNIGSDEITVAVANVAPVV